jgi:hypothetical protein
VAVAPDESPTVTATVNAPEARGIPAINPVVLAIVRPDGNPVADHVYGGPTPPVAASCVVYGTLICPDGSGDGGVISRPGGAMLSV